MIVVDAEFSGLNPHTDSILSIGAVDFSNPNNQFYGECRAFDGAHIHDEALEVNGFTREQATDVSKQSEEVLLRKFIEWSTTCKEWTLAGQVVYVDHDFLKTAFARYHIDWPFARRLVDLHSIATYHHMVRGVARPMKNNHSDLSLDKTLEYLGLEAEPKPHNGLTGAKLESEAFHRLIYRKPLFKEYKEFKTPWFDTNTHMTTKLYRSHTDKIFAGVLGGMAEHFKIDATLLRLAVVFITLVTAVIPVLLTYIVAAIIIPQRPSAL